MRLALSRERLNRHKIVFIALIVFYLIQLIGGAVVFYFATISQTKALTNNISQIAKQDISYRDGKWDTSKYDSDPDIPNYRMYVITKDGYVIDRWQPIPGYLDTS